MHILIIYQSNGIREEPVSVIIQTFVTNLEESISINIPVFIENKILNCISKKKLELLLQIKLIFGLNVFLYSL